MGTRMRLGLITGVVLAAAALVAGMAEPVLAQGCAMCGSALGTDDPTAQAFNTSILFMIAVPYTLFTLGGVWLWLAHRRAIRNQRASVIRFPVVPGQPASAGGPKEV